MVHNIGTDLSHRHSSAKLYIQNKIRLLKARAAKNVTRLNRIDQELYGNGIILRNLAIVQKEQPLAADYIYELLMNNSEILKPAYEELISDYRAGRDNIAFRAFGEKTGTRAGKNFAIILSKLGHINPVELLEQIDVFQEMMAEKRMTRAMKIVERNSIIATTWAAVSIFALLVNFAVVVVFLDAMNMLKSMF